VNNRIKETKDKSLTLGQCAKVLSVAEGELEGLILVALTTGQRIRDVLKLEHTDIDQGKKIIRFADSKTGLILEMPLDPRVVTWAEQQSDSGMPGEVNPLLFPLLADRGPAKSAWSLRRLGRKVSADVYAVSFRHTFLKELYARGVPMCKILEVMGYRSRGRCSEESRDDR